MQAMQAGAIFEHRFEPEPLSLSRMFRRTRSVLVRALFVLPAEVIAHGQTATETVQGSRCHILVPGGFCPAHQPKRTERSARAASWRWMYGTETWGELRTEQLLKEPFCRACAARGLRVRATDVDHIRDHKGDWDVFTDPE